MQAKGISRLVRFGGAIAFHVAGTLDAGTRTPCMSAACHLSESLKELTWRHPCETSIPIGTSYWA